MLRAALFGEMDPVTGVSANIMTGQPIRGGTSFTQILLDEAALANFITTAPPPKKSVERVAVLQDLQSSTKKGCNIEDLRVPAALPPMEASSGEVDLPDMEMNFVDEQ
jgi:hypothetical protein